jgi:hypothetical protein
MFGPELELRGKHLILVWLDDSLLLVDVKNSNQILAEVRYSSFSDVFEYQDRLIIVVVNGQKAKSALWSYSVTDDRPRPQYVSQTPAVWRAKLLG